MMNDTMSTPKTPPKNPNGSEARRTNVLLEKLDRIADDLDLVKLVSRKNNDQLHALKVLWSEPISSNLESLRLEIKLLRDDVKSLTNRLEATDANSVA